MKSRFTIDYDYQSDRLVVECQRCLQKVYDSSWEVDIPVKAFPGVLNVHLEFEHGDHMSLSGLRELEQDPKEASL